jgi:two-component system cell cycle response regulator
VKVLVADDDQISADLLTTYINRLGHACSVAGDGAEAWNLCQENAFDVIVSDWIMPEIDGMDLCKLVRASPSTGYIYFIFVTALAERTFFAQAMEAGADDYLTKPLTLADLRIRLRVAERVTTLYRQVVEQQAELEVANQRLFEQSRLDPLTNLGNRLRLREDLEDLRARAQRYKHAYGMILFDVDRFKAYNDHYGHLAGDDVLRAVAEVTRSRCRQGDAAYRYGGEEFLVILPQQNEETTAIVAGSLLRAIEARGIPHAAAQHAAVVTASAGVAVLHPGDAKGVDDLLKEADEALYRAKLGGRNQVVVHGA